MSERTRKIAASMGAKLVGPVPEVGGGAFEMARLARAVEALRARLVPGRGKRPGRPTDPGWDRHPKVPMSAATERRLAQIAEQASQGGRKVSPMQVAAQLLEEAVGALEAR
ncbi:MAG: hypothetical protein K2W96_00035 [Gemmataceae bacterium]|nr:hypothetical protein [Gemmataceae bacterium]